MADWRRLFRMVTKAQAASIPNAMIAAPTPMPALAPMLNPPSSEPVGCEFEVDDGPEAAEPEEDCNILLIVLEVGPAPGPIEFSIVFVAALVAAALVAACRVTTSPTVLVM